MRREGDRVRGGGRERVGERRERHRVRVGERRERDIEKRGRYSERRDLE